MRFPLQLDNYSLIRSGWARGWSMSALAQLGGRAPRRASERARGLERDLAKPGGRGSRLRARVTPAPRQRSRADPAAPTALGAAWKTQA